MATTLATSAAKVPRRDARAEPFAPGWPGLPARWTSSAKSGIGTAVSRDSRVWFTLSHGILNEVYYPRVDHACTRDLGFLVTDGEAYFSEEKRDAHSETSQVAPGIPAYRIRNTAADGRYRIEKEILTDPWRDVVLQRVRFVPLAGTRADFHLYVLLAPHLANAGAGNTAWVGDYKGSPMLFAERDHHALALASSAPWLARSVGFVGASDGWQQLHADKRLDRTYARAENGNVAMTGEIDLVSCEGTFVMALGFGPTAMEAGQHARITLLEDFDETYTEYVRQWEAWHARLVDGVPPARRTRLSEIAALLVAADLADAASNTTAAEYLRETADAWNASIERWLYVEGTELAQLHGVEGYDVRVAQPDHADAASPCQGFVPIKNRPPDQVIGPAALMVSLDALAFVRFGLRAPQDPRVLNTIKVIDATLKVETPRGPAWHRYQGDGYGEHADGRPYDGSGVGRAWPLLTGERGHYELAAGRLDAAEHLAQAMEAMAGEAGLLPEQIWDSADIPDRELYIGHPSGSAMPLVWAHAEYLKLCRSLSDGRIFDQPPQTVERYLVQQTTSDRIVWRFNNKVRAIPANRTLRVETLAPAVVHWSVDGWRTVQDTATRDTTLGVHVCDLETGHLRCGDRVHLTFYWPDAARWEGVDFLVTVE